MSDSVGLGDMSTVCCRQVNEVLSYCLALCMAYWSFVSDQSVPMSTAMFVVVVVVVALQVVVELLMVTPWAYSL